MKKISILLVFLILSILPVIALKLDWFANLSIFGIPISMVWWFVPVLFLILLINQLIYWIKPSSDLPVINSSIALGVLVFAGTPYLLNYNVEQEALFYVANDHNDLDLPIKANKIALRTRETLNWRRDSPMCNGFCMHTLLSGNAKSVLMLATKRPHAYLRPDTEAIEYTIEKLPKCPTVEFNGWHTLVLARKNRLGHVIEDGQKRSAHAVKIMKQKISIGECFVTKKAKLSDADIIISKGRVVYGSTQQDYPGFSLTINPVYANRLTVHQKMKDDGKFKEVYRWTGVQYSPFNPVLIPGFQISLIQSYPRRSFGWWRTYKIMNYGEFYSRPTWPGYHRTNWIKFLKDTLFLNLYLDEKDIQEKILDKIENVLVQNRAPSFKEWTIFSKYFSYFYSGSRKKMDQSSFNIAVKMLENQEFPAPPNTHTIIEYAEYNSSPETLEKLADVLFTRLENTTNWHDKLNVSKEKVISNLSKGIGELPSKYLLPHFDRHLKLVSKKVIKQYAKKLITKLHVHGERAVPKLVELFNSKINDEESEEKHNMNTNSFTAACNALSLLGDKARVALPDIKTAWRDGRLNISENSTLKLLVRVGVDPEEIWPAYLAANETRLDRGEKWLREFYIDKVRDARR